MTGRGGAINTDRLGNSELGSDQAVSVTGHVKLLKSISDKLSSPAARRPRTLGPIRATDESSSGSRARPGRAKFDCPGSGSPGGSRNQMSSWTAPDRLVATAGNATRSPPSHCRLARQQQRRGGGVGRVRVSMRPGPAGRTAGQPGSAAVRLGPDQWACGPATRTVTNLNELELERYVEPAAGTCQYADRRRRPAALLRPARQPAPQRPAAQRPARGPDPSS